LKKAVAALNDLLKTGTETFIKVATEGFAKGMTGTK
jgi:hypothetical protein